MKHILSWKPVAAAVALACVVSACSDEEVKPEESITPPVEQPVPEVPNENHIDYVYAAFNEQINGKWVASLWNPGGGIARMSDGTKTALVTGMCIGKDNSLYTAGSEQNSKGQHYAKYWFNCSQVILMDSTSSNLFSHADDIAVSGENVYVAGARWDGEHMVALYWENGTPIDLTSGETDAYAKEIFVSGSDVYIVGTVENEEKITEAKLWKNGKEVDLGGTYASSLFVEGADVYVAGDFGSESKYWKNGSFVNLDGAPQKPTDAIFVKDGSVYVAGSGSYWKDGTVFNLTTGENIPKLTSVFAVGEDIYVGGSEPNGSKDTHGTRDVARYWKNSVPVDVTDGSNDAWVSSVVVMRLTAN